MCNHQVPSVGVFTTSLVERDALHSDRLGETGKDKESNSPAFVRLYQTRTKKTSGPDPKLAGHQ